MTRMKRARFVTMYDAIAPSRFPPINQESLTVAVAAYADLDYRSDWGQTRQKFPVLAREERVVSIAGSTNSTARILDYEPGNPCYGDPTAAAAWVVRMQSEHVYRPGVYADRSDMPTIQRALAHLPRRSYSLWLAFPGARLPRRLLQTFDAVQYQFDRTYDVSLCRQDFFPPLKTAAHGKVKFRGEMNLDTHRVTVHRARGGHATWGNRPGEWVADLRMSDRGKFAEDGKVRFDDR